MIVYIKTVQLFIFIYCIIIVYLLATSYGEIMYIIYIIIIPHYGFGVHVDMYMLYTIATQS